MTIVMMMMMMRMSTPTNKSNAKTRNLTDFASGALKSVLRAQHDTVSQLFTRPSWLGLVNFSCGLFV